MNYKVRGIITKIEEVKTLDNGAKVLNYIVEHTSENNWITPFNINMYKKDEYVSHIDKFLEFNKVGDEVEVEFTIRGQEYNGKVYNNLSHWRCDKVSVVANSTPTQQEHSNDGLPF